MSSDASQLLMTVIQDELEATKAERDDLKLKLDELQGQNELLKQNYESLVGKFRKLQAFDRALKERLADHESKGYSTLQERLDKVEAELARHKQQNEELREAHERERRLMSAAFVNVGLEHHQFLQQQQQQPPPPPQSPQQGRAGSPGLQSPELSWISQQRQRRLGL